MSDPRPYICSGCSASGCKLWRQYQTFAEKIRLLCVRCAEKDQGRAFDPARTDQIGWLVPAVPVDDTFWGYTSVPPEGVAWWKSLPLQSS